MLNLRKRNLIWLLFISIVVSTMIGCGSNHGGGGNDPQNPPTNPDPPITACGKIIIKDGHSSGTVAAKRARTLLSVSNPLVQALYFGELEIVAYSYRPGQSIQAHFEEGGFVNPDWSYWVIMQSGTDAGRNNILKTGQLLDINAINRTNSVQYIPQEFIANVGAFSIDIFEVNVAQTGVVYDSKYYGPVTSPDQLYKEPTYSSTPLNQAMVNYPGGLLDSGTVSILFIRSDWFPNPVVVTKQAGVYVPVDGGTLTPTQQVILTNFKNGGTFRRIYNTFIIIPFDGPIGVNFNGTGSSQTYDTNISVTFDLANLLDPSSNFETTPYKVVYQGVNYIPFGLSVSMTKL